jgi:hypothetical protein
MRVFTVGHSTHSLDELHALLAQHDVGRVADARRVPRSARHPQFRAEALAAELPRRAYWLRTWCRMSRWRAPATPVYLRSAESAWRPSQHSPMARAYRGASLRSVRRVLAVLLAMGAVAGVTVAVAAERSDDSGQPPAVRGQAPGSQALPAPDAALPRTPGSLAAALTVTMRRLHGAVRRWGAVGAVPRDVTYLALYHQRMLRLMASRRALGDATLARLPGDVRGEARDTVIGRRELAAIPRARRDVCRVCASRTRRRRASCAVTTPRRKALRGALVDPRGRQLRRIVVRARAQRQRGGRPRPDAVLAADVAQVRHGRRR